MAADDVISQESKGAKSGFQKGIEIHAGIQGMVSCSANLQQAVAWCVTATA